MANILSTVMGSATVQATETAADGTQQTVEKAVPVVKQVTFMLDRSTPHTLTFLDKGTKIKDGRGIERTVGDDATPYHQFTDPQEAVSAYLDGKV